MQARKEFSLQPVTLVKPQNFKALSERERTAWYDQAHKLREANKKRLTDALGKVPWGKMTRGCRTHAEAQTLFNKLPEELKPFACIEEFEVVPISLGIF